MRRLFHANGLNIRYPNNVFVDAVNDHLGKVLRPIKFQ